MAGGAGLLMPMPVLIASLGYLGGAMVIAAHWRRGRFGAANLVTLARVVGTCWVIGLTLQATLGWLSPPGLAVMVTLGTCCLLLDGVDGRVARARGETSTFGARFDVETDAALLLALSVVVPVLGVAGWWVMAIGLMRYAYVAAAWMGPRWLRSALHRPLPYRYSGKVVAVIQGIALLVALTLSVTGVTGTVPILPTLVLGPALAALCWSFGRDIAWQVSQSPTRASTPRQ